MIKIHSLKQWLNQQPIRNLSWLQIGFVCLVSIIILLTLQQKLQNEQAELVQPDTSQQIEAKLSALPQIGQTFVPRQAGLRGIYLPMQVVETTGNPALTLHVRSNSPSTSSGDVPSTDSGNMRVEHVETNSELTKDIRTVTLPISELKTRNLARFSFDPLPNSFNTPYYFFIEATPNDGEATIILYHGDMHSYVDGALYIDGEPHQAQASFYLSYDRRYILFDWIDWSINNLGAFIVILAISFLPGSALLLWLGPSPNSFNHIEWLAMTAGLTVATYPVLLLVASLVGLPFGPISLTLLLLLALVAIGLHVATHNRILTTPQISLSPPIVLFWVIFTLSAITRIVIIRGQDFPMWGDSYHHTVISQLLVERGGLFTDWRPYADIVTMTYHFGFHTFVAVYHWLAGTEIQTSVLVIGQTLNLLTVLAAFLLGRQLGGNDWAGAFAALITGLISDYPMYYVNWGRYTQLAGQIILPSMMVLTWHTLKTDSFNPKLLILNSLGVAGLALTHYRVLFFYPCFVLAILLLHVFETDSPLRRLWADMRHLALIALGSLFLIIPWIWNVAGSKLWVIQSTLAQQDKKHRYVQQLITDNGSIFDHASALLILLAFLGLIWGCWHRQRGVFLIGIWSMLLFVLAYPHLFNLPGTALITYFAVLIATYIPLSVLAGYIMAKVSQMLIALHHRLAWIIVLVAIGVGLMGMPERIALFNPKNSHMTKPDLQTMTWIRENLPASVRFWINNRLAYSGTIVAGTDAGWWLPFLTGRNSLVMPMAYGTEITEPPTHARKMVELYWFIQEHDFSSPEVWKQLKDNGVSHIYIGQRHGEVWRGPEKILDSKMLQTAPFYRPIYQRDLVWIFEVCDQIDTCQNK
ncbi:hypothetical protein QUF63_07735 [Anaerolineales bacterium HSG25]|nr:hypothetical protein [Anaerolineales bacterium HSG25]